VRNGSIDWLCWPEFSSPACLAALLGTPMNGRWPIAPKSSRTKVTGSGMFASREDAALASAIQCCAWWIRDMRSRSLLWKSIAETPLGVPFP
jgi:hypothetical protein